MIITQSMSERNPKIFKLIGYNERYLDNPNAWIRRLRIYVVTMAILMSAILLMLVLSL